jgi:hypothetical protein
MRFLRFSIKRLLILVAIVAALLYFLKTRPVTNAEQFIHEVQTATDLRPISEKYFGGERVEGGVLIDGGTLQGCTLEPRTWTDIVTCRQRFTIIKIAPYHILIDPPGRDGRVITRYSCYSTPFNTKFKNQTYSISME